jgi:N4-(beta-N-acetylglucosaminyl)-L-asparaginase
MTRRTLVLASAAATQLRAAKPGDIVVSSENGLRACTRAMEMLRSGKDTLDAVIAGVNINEEDPEDTSVGYGGLPNEEGVVELDACVMHGPSRRAGSVASIRGIKTPSKIAKLVMTESDHIMLAGDGALRFAKAFGFAEENLLTEKSRLAWLVWKRTLRDAKGHNNWTGDLDAPLKAMFPSADAATLAWAWEMAKRPPTGTINCLALNAKGEMSGVTTTSGLAWKIPGRVGDSPIIGAGLYVDQDVGGAGSTGRGEENIRIAGAHTIVENMRHGMGPKEACLDALKRVSRNFNDDKSKLSQFDLYFYALRKDGAYAGASLWNNRMRNDKMVPSQFSVSDGGQSRHEPCAFLLERKA